MALTLTRANRILAKAFHEMPYPPHMRAAQAGERHLGRWVRDRHPLGAAVGAETLEALVAQILEAQWPEFRSERLTDKERGALRHVPSNVARWI